MLVLTLKSTKDFSNRISQTLVKIFYNESLADEHRHELEVFTDFIKPADFGA
jgi:hypothetical protein